MDSKRKREVKKGEDRKEDKETGKKRWRGEKEQQKEGGKYPKTWRKGQEV
jgi:hypothetical protein